MKRRYNRVITAIKVRIKALEQELENLTGILDLAEKEESDRKDKK